MPRTEQDALIRLEDYRPTDFVIETVGMTLRFQDGTTEVETKLTLHRRPGIATETPLVLDGDELALKSVALDGRPLADGEYEATPERLTVFGPPAEGAFELAITTFVHPEQNTKLMGLYRSNGVWCTQCEADGFRRIAYFLDRPDVLAVYTVRLEADREAAPVLLSNGNLVESGEMAGGRHFAVWHDPFPKPSYLFAVVAGDLDALEDGFRTMGGRDVKLAVYTEKGLAHQARYAMDALKRSMKWDEARFGREYDLDVFNVVAISDFNMGAMENKGLNIFNHKYVLLDPDTATDADYAGVETVIAHEYFHNWTGNRITCRDWFQLCLKEGLTVYRDQEFTADQRSRPVKRIASVRGLKAHQFAEDQGPLQHPVRPRQYREINNFYTATVYEKGAELVRMIAVILGEDDFRKGMDLYFERHDGDAATIEDFIACFEEASGRSLAQFALWYAQAGTPRLTVKEEYDPAGRLTLRLAQHLPEGAARTGTAPMHIPVRFGLVGPGGEDMAVPPAEGAEVTGDVIHLRKAEETVRFEGLSARPRVSVLRDFSAPVELLMEQSTDDRLALARTDPNPFNRWRFLHELVSEALTDAARNGGDVSANLEPRLVEALAATAFDAALDPALRAQAIALPSETDIARFVAEDVDPAAVHTARSAARRTIARALADDLGRLYEDLADGRAFSPDAESAGRRALRNVALDYLSAAEGDAGRAARQFDEARNMTDRSAAFLVLLHQFPDDPAAERAAGAFFERYQGNSLVVDKWFSAQATIPRVEALDRVKALSGHRLFSLKNPNRVRALVGGFAAGNPLAFNRPDGEGYRWVADRLVELDRINPQVAARLATAFRSWRSLEPGRRGAARESLSEVSKNKDLSVNLRDIVERTLAS